MSGHDRNTTDSRRLFDQHRRDIEALVEFTPFIGGLLHQAVEDWQALVAAGDLEGFAAAMEGCRHYLAEANDEVPGVD